METTHEGLSTSDVWKSYWSWSRYNEVKRQLHIWPWDLKHSRSRQQIKVKMERTHQGLSTSEVWKRYWPWWRYNEVKCQLHIWPWNLEHSMSRSQKKGHNGNNSSRSIYIWSVKRVIDHGLGTMKLNANNRFDLETWNLHGQGHRQRSQWVELIKVYLKCERGIDHGVGTMKLNANYIFHLETWNIQGQGHRQRSWWKELIKVYLHLKC